MSKSYQQALLFSVVTGALTACGGGGSTQSDSQPTTADVPPTLSCSDAGKQAAAASAFPVVCMLTTKGELVIELYPAIAPKTVANFLKYVDAKAYDNTMIHRVVKDFVVQGGGYTTSGNEIPSFGTIPLESNNGLSNKKYTVGMARTSDPNSATSQFFINSADNSNCLDAGKTACDSAGKGYAVFAKVISGTATVDAINVVPTGSSDLPKSPVTVYWVQKVKN